MRKLKFLKQLVSNKKAFLLAASMAALLLVSVAGTIAFLSDSSLPVTNIFEVTEVKNDIDETFDGKIKTNVAVENTGDADSYIRAMVVFTLAKETDAGKVSAAEPQAGTHYTIQWNVGTVDQNGGQWIKGTDGFYYYTKKVPAGEADAADFPKTGVLIQECKPIEGAIPDGHILSVEIIAQSIQADGVVLPASGASEGIPAVETVWPVKVGDGGVLTLNSPASISE